MKEENNILAKVAHRDGLTVPDGYFADFAASMAAKLPVRDEIESPRIIAKKRSLWDACRPYAYMAAMFAGVWCLIKMLTLMAATDSEINFENDPILAEAATNEEVVEEFIVSDISQYEIYESWMENYTEEDSLYFAENFSMPADSTGFAM